MKMIIIIIIMLFNIEQFKIKEEIPIVKEKTTELLKYHADKLTVNYIGKANPSLPAVIVI